VLDGEMEEFGLLQGQGSGYVVAGYQICPGIKTVEVDSGLHVMAEDEDAGYCISRRGRSNGAKDIHYIMCCICSH
jgi:hypothetical protein